MKQRELAEKIADNVIDTIYEAVREQAGSGFEDGEHPAWEQEQR